MSQAGSLARLSSAAALLPVAFGSSLVLTVWLRYGGRISDSDTATITRAVRGVMEQEVARPGGGVAYTNGFSYPVLVAFVARTTGLSVEQVQSLVLPWMLVALALVAFVTFRAIAGSARAGAVSTLLLLVQPDFLFVTQRGSHEKVTWLLVLTLVFCLVSTFRRPEPRLTAPFILVFYAVGFALICSNAFFGSSFIASVLFVLVGTALVGRLLLKDLPARRIPRRFVYPLITLGCFSFLFMFHIYPVAQHGLVNLDSTIQRVAALYLSSEPAEQRPESDEESNEVTAADEDEVVQTAAAQRPTAVSPYATIAGTWTSIEVYFLLTAFTWVLIAWAALTWFLTAARFFRRGVYQQEIPLFVAWSFAAATGLQVALSILGDTTGSFGSNVQLRLFPSFALFAVPLVVTAPSIRHRVFRSASVRRLTGRFRWLAGRFKPTRPAATREPGVHLGRPRWLSPPDFGLRERFSQVRAALAVAIFSGFAIAALLKATNDPIVSNKWVFFSAPEARALRWVERQIPTNVLVWSEFDERLAAVARAYIDETPLSPSVRRWAVGSTWQTETVRYALVSDITVARAARLAVPVPGSKLDDRIYDNGRVQVIHRVPDTPFQP